MKNRQKIGVSITATMNDTARAMATVIGSAMMNSPTDPVRIRSGRNEKMIVTVAVKTGTTTSLTQRQAASALADFAVEKIHVVVGNDDGIIHDNPEDHDQCGDGHLMQRDPDGVHGPQGCAERYRDGKCRDHGDPDGQQENRDEDDRGDGQHEFMAQDA